MDWQHLLSRGRLGVSHKPLGTTTRSDFQRDFDRIVFCQAFRRLQDKTQVFPLAQSSFARTRLTHSLEVACVGRSLGASVGEVLIERYGLSDNAQDIGAIIAAACLAHDIGNPPFGHAGEDAIRQWFRKSEMAQSLLSQLSPAQQQDFLWFEGNAQGFRVLTRLQNPANAGGLQLTYATLGTFCKYPRSSQLDTALEGVAFRKFGFVQADQPLFTQVAQTLRLTPVHENAWRRHPLAYLVEAADDICYCIVDVEDAYRLHQIEFAEAQALLMPLVREKDRQHALSLAVNLEQIEFLRAKAIGYCIDEVTQLFLDCETTLRHSDAVTPLAELTASGAALAALKQRAEQKIYVSMPVVSVGAAGFQVLSALLERFAGVVADPHAPQSRMLRPLLPRPLQGDTYHQLLQITDFIADLPDSSAVELYKRLMGISLPTFNHPRS